MSIKDCRINKKSADFKLFNKIFQNPDLGDSYYNKCEYHHVKVYDFKYWNTSSGRQFKEHLDKCLDKFNQQSKNYIAKIVDYTDYEVESDYDRFWPASYGIRFEKK